MGEIADSIIDAMLDRMVGGDSSEDWDDWEQEDDAPRGPQPKRCKYCGEHPLYWYEVWPHHWRLRRSDGTPHKCDHTPKTGRLLQDLRRRFK
jgi:hypothetical protein